MLVADIILNLSFFLEKSVKNMAYKLKKGKKQKLNIQKITCTKRSLSNNLFNALVEVVCYFTCMGNMVDEARRFRQSIHVQIYISGVRLYQIIFKCY